MKAPAKALPTRGPQGGGKSAPNNTPPGNPDGQAPNGPPMGGTKPTLLMMTQAGKVNRAPTMLCKTMGRSTGATTHPPCQFIGHFVAAGPATPPHSPPKSEGERKERERERRTRTHTHTPCLAHLHSPCPGPWGKDADRRAKVREGEARGVERANGEKPEPQQLVRTHLIEVFAKRWVETLRSLSLGLAMTRRSGQQNPQVHHE